MERKEIIPNNSIESEVKLGSKVEFQVAPEKLGDEMIRFTPEARKALEDAGFMIFDLNGDSIRELIQDGMPIEQIPYSTSELPSMQSQVALDMRLVRIITGKSSGYISNHTEGIGLRHIQPIRFEGPGSLQRNRDRIAITYIHNLGINSDDIDTNFGNIADWAQIHKQYYEKTGQLLLAQEDAQKKDYLSSGPWIGTRPGRQAEYPSSTYYDLIRWEPGPQRKNRGRRLQIETQRNKRGETIPLIVPAQLRAKMGLPPTERLRIPEEEAPLEVGDVRYASLPDGTRRRVLVNGIDELIDKKGSSYTFAHCYLILENRQFQKPTDIIPQESGSRTQDQVAIEMDLYASIDTSIISSTRTLHLSQDELKEIHERYKYFSEHDGYQNLTPEQIEFMYEELAVIQRLAKLPDGFEF